MVPDQIVGQRTETSARLGEAVNQHDPACAGGPRYVGGEAARLGRERHRSTVGWPVR